MTIICDRNGKLLAASLEGDGWLTPSMQQNQRDYAGQQNQRDYAGLFGPESDLTHWIAAQMQHAGQDNDRGASSDISHNGEVLNVKLECLKNGGELFGYALFLSPQLQGQGMLADQERWHDIKNHIGSLKLYATFLLKKLPDSEDKQVVERLLKAIDTLADELARIRRGDRT
ncbi:MAG TPA: hypothetical protein VI756_07365 [Blastocatellia bacterium]